MNFPEEFFLTLYINTRKCKTIYERIYMQDRTTVLRYWELKTFFCLLTFYLSFVCLFKFSLWRVFLKITQSVYKDRQNRFQWIRMIFETGVFQSLEILVAISYCLVTIKKLPASMKLLKLFRYRSLIKYKNHKSHEKGNIKFSNTHNYCFRLIFFKQSVYILATVFTTKSRISFSGYFEIFTLTWCYVYQE